MCIRDSKRSVAILPPGQRVRVLAGPFKDLEGVVLKEGRETRLVVFFDSIMQGVEVSIFPDILMPIKAPVKPLDNNSGTRSGLTSVEKHFLRP